MTRARELGKLANTNTLTADNTNNFVGIASTQPTTRLDVVGVVSATSFSGDGSSLTGIAATDNVSTNGLVVLGISTLAGATFSGVSTFSNNVILEANLDLQDNDKILLGTGDDLQIYHDGTNSWVKDVGTNALVLDTDGPRVTITKNGATETMANFNTDGSVDLDYDNSKKLETTSDGVTVTGTIDGQTELRTWLFG